MRISRISPKKTDGILYLITFELDGKSLIKIGVTTRSIEDRVIEILLSIFKAYREFPYCRPKRFKRTSDIYAKEALLHKYFTSYKHTTAHKFDGSTEFFDIDEGVVVDVYERLLNGEDIFEGTEVQGYDARRRI